MQPHANFGIRWKGVSLTAKRGHGRFHGSRSTNRKADPGSFTVAAILAAMGINANRTPFWRRMGNRG